MNTYYNIIDNEELYTETPRIFHTWRDACYYLVADLLEITTDDDGLMYDPKQDHPGNVVQCGCPAKTHDTIDDFVDCPDNCYKHMIQKVTMSPQITLMYNDDCDVANRCINSDAEHGCTAQITITYNNVAFSIMPELHDGYNDQWIRFIICVINKQTIQIKTLEYHRGASYCEETDVLKFGTMYNGEGDYDVGFILRIPGHIVRPLLIKALRYFKYHIQDYQSYNSDGDDRE